MVFSEHWKLLSINGATMFIAFALITMPRNSLAALCVVLMVAVPMTGIAILAVLLRITTVEAIHSIIPWEQWPRVLTLYATLLVSALLISYRMHVRMQRSRVRSGATRFVINPLAGPAAPSTSAFDLVQTEPQMEPQTERTLPAPMHALSRLRGSLNGYTTLPS